jgi:PAS domain S-box-containing protein
MARGAGADLLGVKRQGPDSSSRQAPRGAVDHRDMPALSSAGRSHALVAALNDGVAVIGRDHRVIDVNPALCAMTGYSEEDWIGLAPPFPIWPEEDCEDRARALAKAVADGHGRREVQLERSGGERFRATVDVCPMEGGAIACVIRDVTVQRADQDALRLQARLLDEIDASVVATDLDGLITYWGKGAERLYGRCREEAIGRSIMALGLIPLHGETSAAMLAAMSSQVRWEGELDVPRSDGTPVRVDLRIAPVTDDDGATVGLIGIAVDISERVRSAAELRAARDHLRTVTDSMAEGLYTVDAEGRVTYVNSAAERMLGWTAAELTGRSMHQTVHYRHGDGSPFPDSACPLLAVRQTHAVVHVEDDLFIRKDGTELPVSYTSSPLETAGAGDCGAVVVFSDASERRAQRARHDREIEALTWIGRIRSALDEDRMVLHAQPIVDLATGATVRHELLIRMLDERGRLVAPGLFLPVAEEYGLIREIDRWVIARAAELAAAGEPLEINLSAESLGDPSLLGFVEQVLASTGADASLLVFELTETALLRDETAARTFIDGAVRLGSGVALDDFGTGYGGFTYLKRLPIDFLKIDVEFVRDLPSNPASRHVVRAVVSLARDFGLRTVAEGVEDDETLELLRVHGVDLVQGYLLGRPAPLDETLGTGSGRVSADARG